MYLHLLHYVFCCDWKRKVFWIKISLFMFWCGGVLWVFGWVFFPPLGISASRPYALVSPPGAKAVVACLPWYSACCLYASDLGQGGSTSL